MPEERPTAESVDKLFQYLSEVWKKTHEKWIEIDSYYNLTFKLWENGVDRPEYRSPRPRSIIDSAVDNQLSGTPKVHRPHSGRSEAKAVRADKIEPWVSAMFDETSVLEVHPTWKQIAKHMMLYGYTIVEQALHMADMPEAPDPDAYDEEDLERVEAIYQNQKRAWMPFRIRSPHPSKVLLDPTQKTPRYAIKKMSRYAIDLHEMTKCKMDLGRAEHVYEVGDNPYERVVCMEYWSKEWHALVSMHSTHGAKPRVDRLLIVEPNIWGFVPFSHTFSGFGVETTEDEFNPSQVAVGMLDPLLDALLIQAQALSGRHNALLEASFQIWGTTKSAHEIADHLRRGDIVPGIRQQDLFKVSIPNLPGWMFKAESEIDADIEEATYSRQLSGIREEGVDTVGQQAILSTAAARKFVMPQRQIEHLATITAERMLMLLDVVLDEPITIQGHTLKPEDLDHDYSIQVKFNIVDPVLQLQNKQLGMQEVSAGLISKETYWSAYAQLEDSTGEKKRILKEMVEQSPEVVQFLAMEVAREFGLIQILEQAQQNAQGSPQGSILGPDGQPLSSTMGSGVGAAGSIPQALTGDTPGQPRLPLTGAEQLGGG